MLYWDFSFLINISLGKVKFQVIMEKKVLIFTATSKHHHNSFAAKLP